MRFTGGRLGFQALALASLAISLTACGQTEPASSGADSARDMLNASSARMSEVETFKAAMSTDIGQAVDVEIDIQAGLDGKRSLAVRAESRDGVMQFEAVVDGPDTYISFPGDGWSRADSDDTEIKDVLNLGRITSRDGGTLSIGPFLDLVHEDPWEGYEFEFAVEELIDGVPATHARAVLYVDGTSTASRRISPRDDNNLARLVDGLDELVEETTSITVDAWVDEDGYVRRFTAELTGAEGLLFRTNLTFTDIGEAITIRPPEEYGEGFISGLSSGPRFSLLGSAVGPSPASAASLRGEGAPPAVPRDASGRRGLWAGAVPDAYPYAIPWLALRFAPGADPDVDPWRVGGGRFGPPVLECEPTPVSGGWNLGGCTDTRGRSVPGLDLSAFVPEEGDAGLEVTLDRGHFKLHAALAKVAQRAEPQSSDNVTLLWREDDVDSLNSDIWVDDGIVFAPRLDSRIALLDAATGELISFAGILGAMGEGVASVYDVKARDGVLYAATVSHGLVIFDVSEPESPELIGQHYAFESKGSDENFTNVHNIFLAPDGPFVYAINQSFQWADLRVIDVSDPAAPREAGRFAIDEGLGQAHDVHVIRRGGKLIAFLNYLTAGLWVLDVTDPETIEPLGTIGWDGTFSHGGWAFEANGVLYYAHTSEGYDQSLKVLDVSDLSSPREVSTFKTRDGISIHNVEVLDGFAYISYYIDGLRVVDLRDPRHPVEVAHYDTVAAEDEFDILQGAWGIKVYDGAVYVSDIETGVYAFSVDLP